jgi:hypothetical protein
MQDGPFTGHLEIDIGLNYEPLWLRLIFTLFWITNWRTHFIMRHNSLIVTVNKLHSGNNLFCTPIIQEMIKPFLTIIVEMIDC